LFAAIAKAEGYPKSYIDEGMLEQTRRARLRAKISRNK
jgi:hypothetical protein